MFSTKAAFGPIFFWLFDSLRNESEELFKRDHFNLGILFFKLKYQDMFYLYIFVLPTESRWKFVFGIVNEN